MKRERLQLPPEQTHRNWKRKKSIRRRKRFYEEKTYKMFNCQLPILFFQLASEMARFLLILHSLCTLKLMMERGVISFKTSRIFRKMYQT